jgi:hypothetical protein
MLMMTVPTAAVRRLSRVRDRATQRSKEISEWPCVCHISPTDQHGDRYPDYDCAERSFHWDCFVSAGCRGCPDQSNNCASNVHSWSHSKKCSKSDLISDALPFERTDNVSGRYRSVNKFDAAKPTHAGVS